MERIQWEYKLQEHSTISTRTEINVTWMNEVGENGWELVSSILDIRNGNTEKVQLYFKRPKKDQNLN